MSLPPVKNAGEDELATLSCQRDVFVIMENADRSAEVIILFPRDFRAFCGFKKTQIGRRGRCGAATIIFYVSENYFSLNLCPAVGVAQDRKRGTIRVARGLARRGRSAVLSQWRVPPPFLKRLSRLGQH